MQTYKTNSNIVHSCSYHVVFCTKYRRDVLTLDIQERLKDIIKEVCKEKNCTIVTLETMSDHVHILIQVDPQYGIHKVVKGIKGRSSRILRKEFKSIRSRIPTLWTNSYFVSTVGSVTSSIVEKYIEEQKTK